MTLLGIVLGNPGNPETFEPGCLAFVEIKSTDECEPADCTPYFGKMENYRRNELVISLSKWKAFYKRRPSGLRSTGHLCIRLIKSIA